MTQEKRREHSGLRRITYELNRLARCEASYRLSLLWTASVAGSIGVPDNVTLTIEAAVRIVVGPSDKSKIVIRGGRLIIKGTSQKPVRFEEGSFDHKTHLLNFLASDLSKSSVTHAQFTGPKPALRLMSAFPCRLQLLSILYSTKHLRAAGRVCQVSKYQDQHEWRYWMLIVGQ